MPLSNQQIAILATDGFEQAELMDPLEKLRRRATRSTSSRPRAGNPRLEG